MFWYHQNHKPSDCNLWLTIFPLFDDDKKDGPSNYVIYQVQKNIMTLNKFYNISKSHTHIYISTILFIAFYFLEEGGVEGW